MTDKTRYTFHVRDTAYAEDDPDHRWQTACAPRLCDSDAQAEHHARWLAKGTSIRIGRGGVFWMVASPRGR